MSFLSSLFRKAPAPAPAAPAPPPGHKPNRFRADADAFATRCAAWLPLLPSAPPPGAAHAAIVISPWLSTPVPFFAMECALALLQAGLRVTLLWDGTEIVGNVPNKKHLAVISSLFPSLPAALPRVDVSSLTPIPSEADAEPARRLIYENAVRHVRGEMNTAAFFEAHPHAQADTLQHLGRIRAALRQGRFAWLLLPGGIFGVSAAYLEVARQEALPFSTFDSGPGRLRLVHQGVAAHLADLPRAWEIIETGLTPDQRAQATHLARAELEKRTQGRDDRGFQLAPATGQPETCDLLIPLNIRWDSAALGRQRLFATVEESIAAVLDWAAARPGVTVCIRQHPNERRDHLRGSDDWQPFLARFAHLGPRLRWVGAGDPVSTYDLIRSARAVLPHTSTVGIEAALLGTPVILSTDVYYRAFPFVWAPETREEFFQLLDRALSGDLPMRPGATESAALAYFLTQQCAVMLTPFTPQNPDYEKWMALPPATLWSQPEPRTFLQSLTTRTPLAALRARQILGNS